MKVLYTHRLVTYNEITRLYKPSERDMYISGVNLAIKHNSMIQKYYEESYGKVKFNYIEPYNTDEVALMKEDYKKGLSKIMDRYNMKHNKNTLTAIATAKEISDLLLKAVEWEDADAICLTNILNSTPELFPFVRDAINNAGVMIVYARRFYAILADSEYSREQLDELTTFQRRREVIFEFYTL